MENGARQLATKRIAQMGLGGKGKYKKKDLRPEGRHGAVQKGPSSKAAGTLAHGAFEYVSREPREARQVCEPEGQTKERLCLGEPLRQSQGTPLADFFNSPIR